MIGVASGAFSFLSPTRRFIMTRCAAIFVLGVALFSGATSFVAADDKADAGKKELEKLQGTWRFQSHEHDGKAMAKEQVEGMTITFTGDKWTVKVGDMVVQAGTHKFDPTQKPATVDATVTEGENKGKTMLGIYELKDDTIKVCFDPEGKTRPTEFKTTPDSGRFLAVVKREK